MLKMASPFKHLSEAVESALKNLLPLDDTEPASLHQAMRYTTLSGGKRLRGVLVLAGGSAVGGSWEPLLPAAAAVELVHAYSLIHDDLPCMDDDDLRRGKPANHIVYGEAIALLAGDALLTEAFTLLAGVKGSPPHRVLDAVAALAAAGGSRGMVGGQVDDLANTADIDLDRLNSIYDRKTGALLTASVSIGANLAGATPAEMSAIELYGTRIGRAFQVIDDILDEVGKTEVIGKPAGSDRAAGKRTYPAILGVKKSREIAVKLVGEAKDALVRMPGDVSTLNLIADFILDRDR